MDSNARAGVQDIYNQRVVLLGHEILRLLKLATARGFHPQTATSSLASVLGLDTSVDETQLYAALDWLLGRQHNIENALAKRHLTDGSLVLYDVSSTYFEGRQWRGSVTRAMSAAATRQSFSDY